MKTWATIFCCKIWSSWSFCEWFYERFNSFCLVLISWSCNLTKKKKVATWKNSFMFSIQRGFNKAKTRLVYRQSFSRAFFSCIRKYIIVMEFSWIHLVEIKFAGKLLLCTHTDVINKAKKLVYAKRNHSINHGNVVMVKVKGFFPLFIQSRYFCWPFLRTIESVLYRIWSNLLPPFPLLRTVFDVLKHIQICYLYIQTFSAEAESSSPP